MRTQEWEGRGGGETADGSETSGLAAVRSGGGGGGGDDDDGDGCDVTRPGTDSGKTRRRRCWRWPHQATTTISTIRVYSMQCRSGLLDGPIIVIITSCINGYIWALWALLVDLLIEIHLKLFQCQ